VVSAVHPLVHPRVPPFVKRKLEVLRRRFGELTRHEHPPRPVALQIDQDQVPGVLPETLKDRFHIGVQNDETAKFGGRPAGHRARVGPAPSIRNRIAFEPAQTTRTRTPQMSSPTPIGVAPRCPPRPVFSNTIKAVSAAIHQRLGHVGPGHGRTVVHDPPAGRYGAESRSSRTARVAPSSGARDRSPFARSLRSTIPSARPRLPTTT
jgi:hypothetical protein